MIIKYLVNYKKNKFLKIILLSLVYPILVSLGCIYLEIVGWGHPISDYILIIPVFLSLFISYLIFGTFFQTILVTLYGIFIAFFFLLGFLPDV